MYRSLTLLLLCGMPLLLCAQDSGTDSARNSTLKLELTLLDLPYQRYAKDTRHDNFIQGYANPSMSQSLAVTGSFFGAAHYGLKKVYDPAGKPLVRQLGFYTATAIIDYYLAYLPGGNGWLHEEYHRSVMTRRRVNSYNGINALPINAEAVSVSHVKDEDLVRFKQQAPQDFIRMQVAGIEGEYMMVDRLQRNNFFYNQQLPHEPLYLITTLGAAGYVSFSSDPKTADVETHEMNAKESDIRERDFTGFDFTGWVYDLFRPAEPYASRGVHPLGNGIDRYRKTTDLTGEELNYLKRQGKLQYLNLLSPMLYGFRSITIDAGKGIRGNVAVRNLLTSFGNDVSLNIWASTPKHHAVAVFHHYRNRSSSYGALELELVDHPLRVGRQSLLLSPRLIAGTQPAGQQFATGSSEFFGFAGLKLGLSGKSRFQPFIDLYGKTDGWLAGNEFLNRAMGARFGFSFTAYN